MEAPCIARPLLRPSHVARQHAHAACAPNGPLPLPVPPPRDALRASRSTTRRVSAPDLEVPKSLRPLRGAVSAWLYVWAMYAKAHRRTPEEVAAEKWHGARSYPYGANRAHGVQGAAAAVQGHPDTARVSVRSRSLQCAVGLIVRRASRIVVLRGEGGGRARGAAALRGVRATPVRARWDEPDGSLCVRDGRRWGAPREASGSPARRCAKYGR